MERKKVCGNCMYWDSDNDAWGLCRFHAPRPFCIDGNDEHAIWDQWAIWPKTGDDDFCSNWKKIKKGDE